jgi:hypothetical protein
MVVGSNIAIYVLTKSHFSMINDNTKINNKEMQMNLEVRLLQGLTE